MIPIIAVVVGPAIAAAVLATMFCDKLFGRYYMNRANILYPKSKAASFWRVAWCVFAVPCYIIGIMTFISELAK